MGGGIYRTLGFRDVPAGGGTSAARPAQTGVGGGEAGWGQEAAGGCQELSVATSSPLHRPHGELELCGRKL